MRRVICSCLLVSLFLFIGCSAKKEITYHYHDTKHLSDVDNFHFGTRRFKEVTCRAEVEEDFQRGLALAYGFNYPAAEREFRRAAEKDPDCAMAWWGIALVSGPHINFPLVPADKAKIAFEAITKANGLTGKVTPLERALIEAQASRYVENQPADRTSLDQAYAAAMEKVFEKYPDNSDVGALYAEALMDLHPWDLWTNQGDAKEWTPKILVVLEKTLQLEPYHPHANHLYIHAIEASPNPQRAKAAADRLNNSVPGSGHLQHMPAHIYARLGEWEMAAEANIKSIASDNVYSRAYPNPGFYAMYMIHSRHFLAFCRMMQGRSEEALAVAREMVVSIPEQFIKDFGPIADGFLVFVPEVLVRFGKWEEVLREPAPRGNLPFSTAMWRFSRAVSLNALDRFKEAKLERAMFIKAAKKIPADSTFGNNSSVKLALIAQLVLDGEMAAKRKDYKKAISILKRAVSEEDALRYDEPPDWIQPVRHTLGGILIGAGKFKEAEIVYREDLEKFPENVWSLYGLSESLRLQGDTKNWEIAKEHFEKAKSKADVLITSSCLCRLDK